MFSVLDEGLYLTKREQKNEEANNKFERFSYVFDEYEIKHLQNTVCNEIGFSSTIIERDGRRIDSTLSKITNRQACHILRCYLDESFCKECDVKHANELFNNDLTKHKKFKSVKTNDGQVVKYYEYQCPYLGYKELMFPITYNKKVLAVFLVGTRLFGDDENLKQTKNAFFNEYDSKLRAGFEKERAEGFPKANRKITYSKKYNLSKNKAKKIFPCESDQECGKYYNAILENDIKICVEYDKNKIDYKTLKTIILDNDTDSERIIEDMDKLTKDIAVQVRSIEDSIKIKVRQNYIEYINHIVNECISDFYKDISRFGDIIYQKSTKEYWDRIVKDRLIKLTQQLMINKLVLFADNQSGEMDCLNNVVSTDTNGNKIIKYKSFLIGKLSKDNEEKAKTFLNSRDYTRLTDYIGDNLINEKNKNEKLLLYFPLPYNLHKSLALLLCFGKDKAYIDNEVLSNLINQLKLVMACIASVYLSIDDSITAEKLYSLMSIYRHEIAHHTQVIGNINKRYFSSIQKYRDKQDYQIEDAYRDLNGSLRRIHYISINTRWMHNKPETIKKEKVNILNDGFYKYVGAYTIDLRSESKYIHTYTNDGAKELNTDPNYMELMINNLISNAVKYSYRGSKIYLIYKAKRIIVKDYGIAVDEAVIDIKGDEQHKIFNLFERGKIAKGLDAGGAGVSLHVCKLIAEQLQYRIKFTQKKISDFHLPMVYYYANKYRQYRNKSIYHNEIINEYRIKSKEIGECVFDMNKVDDNFPTQDILHLPREISLDKIDKVIKEGTYLITFEIEVN